MGQADHSHMQLLDGTSSLEVFNTSMDSMPLHQQAIIDPVNLGFIPRVQWNPGYLSVYSLQQSYFSRKNNINRRFEHKLWNALRITSQFPELTRYIGVCWVSDTVIKCYKNPFARLLSINCVDGGLFHKQGNFTRHGFLQLTDIEAKSQFNPRDIEDVDFRNVLLLYHKDGTFKANADEATICNCRWDDPTPALRVAQLRILPPNE